LPLSLHRLGAQRRPLGALRRTNAFSPLAIERPPPPRPIPAQLAHAPWPAVVLLLHARHGHHYFSPPPICARHGWICSRAPRRRPTTVARPPATPSTTSTQTADADNRQGGILGQKPSAKSGMRRSKSARRVGRRAELPSAVVLQWPWRQRKVLTTSPARHMFNKMLQCGNLTSPMIGRDCIQAKADNQNT
jgi:hypothetical protein